MIQTVDNFYSSVIVNTTKIKVEEERKKANNYYAISFKKDKDDKNVGEINLTLKDYINPDRYKNNIFFSFFKDEEKTKSKNEDDLTRIMQ